MKKNCVEDYVVKTEWSGSLGKGKPIQNNKTDTENKLIHQYNKTS
jgi:hypothetical protein